MQCVNVKCLHKNAEEAIECKTCGAALLIDGRLRATKLLSTKNLFAPSAVKTFEAFSLEDPSEPLILKVVQSEDELLINALEESALALRQVHLLKSHPGIMQMVVPEGYFSWRVLPDEPVSSFMVTRKVAGEPLDAVIDRKETVNESTAIAWLRQLVESVDALHKEGFVHQDIKPSNIIRQQADNQLVLVDLGAIRFMDATQSLSFEISQGLKPYPVIGTPGYQAQEQSDGRPNHISDYYSIGRTFIHLLTGVYLGELPRSSTGKLLWRSRAQVSEAFADLIDRMAEPNQLFRPASATAIYEYLDSIEQRRGAFAIPTQRMGLGGRWWGKRAVVAWLLACSLPLLAVGAALPVILGRADANRLFSRANQLIYAGEPEQAVPLLEEALDQRGASAEISATLALAHFLAGDTTAAIESYEQALALSPGDAFIHYNLANVYEQVDPQQAIAHYQSAAQAGSPIRAEATNNLARIYLLEGDLDKAEELLDKLLDTRADDIVTQAALLKNRGWLQFERGELDQAIAFLNQAIEQAPTTPDSYCLRALIQRQEEEDNFDDRVTCLSLPLSQDRPEVQGWKAQLIRE
ncbi:MAG: tetratricopeptide repeat protein [Cyanobacteria bacterium P01_F01_bin.86]